MQHNGKPLIVRAYELARTGNFSANKDLRRQLKKEGYTIREIEAEFEGRTFCARLAELMGKRPVRKRPAEE